MTIDVKACLAEFIATFIFVFIGTMSITVSVVIMSFGGGLTIEALTVIALAHGLAISIMIYSIGSISGGHINPAVTIPMVLLRKLSFRNGIGYIIAQLSGASLAVLLHRIILPQGVNVKWGLHQPNMLVGINDGTALLIEGLLTFFLVFTIFGVAVSSKTISRESGIMSIGLIVTLNHFIGVPLTGAGFNPARSFGPALISGVFTSHWIYWIGPIIGGILAAYLYQYLFINETEK